MDPARSALRELTGSPVSPEPRGGRRIGREGRLQLRFGRRGESTILVSRRFAAPLQVLEPLSLAADGSAFVALLNTGGGLLGGDRLHTQLEVGHGAHVGVTTTAATKVYACPGARVLQETLVTVEDDATLEYVPMHVIPHAGAALDQSLHVDLAPGSRLILYDGLSLGRVARGERWVFRSLVSEVRVTESTRPLYWDRLRLTPDRAPRLSGVGGADECMYLGTVLLCAPSRTEWGGVMEELLELVGQQATVNAGTSLLARGGCLVRILAPSAHALTDFVHQVWATGRRHLLGLPPLDLRLG
jgi:urease accessory protein